MFPCSNTPGSNELLFNGLSGVGAGQRLNRAGQWVRRTRVEDRCCTVPRSNPVGFSLCQAVMSQQEEDMLRTDLPVTVQRRAVSLEGSTYDPNLIF